MERKTGASVPVTSMQGSKPDCNVTPRGMPSVSDKAWNKCPEEEKAKFKNDNLCFTENKYHRIESKMA